MDLNEVKVGPFNEELFKIEVELDRLELLVFKMEATLNRLRERMRKARADGATGFSLLEAASHILSGDEELKKLKLELASMQLIHLDMMRLLDASGRQ